MIIFIIVSVVLCAIVAILDKILKPGRTFLIPQEHRGKSIKEVYPNTWVQAVAVIVALLNRLIKWGGATSQEDQRVGFWAASRTQAWLERGKFANLGGQK